MGKVDFPKIESRPSDVSELEIFNTDWAVDGASKWGLEIVDLLEKLYEKHNLPDCFISHFELLK